jgi:Recombination endonuclease VII
MYKDHARQLEYMRRYREADGGAKQRARSNRWSRKKQGLPTPTRPEPTTCECCGGPPLKYSLHIDHDHDTGAFRGWLCFNCNVSIAKLGDNIEGIVRALTYLQKARQ